MSKLALLNVYYDRQEVLVAKSVLDAYGIPALLLSTGPVHPRSTPEFELRVPPSELVTARKLLEISPPGRSTSRCPNCGQFSVARRYLVFLAALLDLLPPIQRWYASHRKCLECGHRWKKES